MTKVMGKGQVINGQMVFKDTNGEVLFSKPVSRSTVHVPVVFEEKPVVVTGFTPAKEEPKKEETKQWFTPLPAFTSRSESMSVDVMPWFKRHMEQKQAKQEPIKKTFLSKAKRIMKTLAEDFGV